MSAMREPNMLLTLKDNVTTERVCFGTISTAPKSSGLVSWQGLGLPREKEERAMTTYVTNPHFCHFQPQPHSWNKIPHTNLDHKTWSSKRELQQIFANSNICVTSCFHKCCTNTTVGTRPLCTVQTFHLLDSAAPLLSSALWNCFFEWDLRS